ncbi:unnamed protein product [Trichogramma brassicae]|uniref:Retrovirus-related Pol polyprotein from transposon TNT 1-94-like beta-barrel domain-containing protein n=1 Tax=Trichogramma brassicae TaxID=86971 RepID=A0A6H5IT33_9HYME|nr:unnamed protein product [Trichogramma brassicae]
MSPGPSRSRSHVVRHSREATVAPATIVATHSHENSELDASMTRRLRASTTLACGPDSSSSISGSGRTFFVSFKIFDDHATNLWDVNKDASAWMMDFGATSHMTGRREVFSVYEHFKNPNPVRLGDGNFLYAVGKVVRQERIRIYARPVPPRRGASARDRVLSLQPPRLKKFFSKRPGLMKQNKSYSLQVVKHCLPWKVLTTNIGRAAARQTGRPRGRPPSHRALVASRFFLLTQIAIKIAFHCFQYVKDLHRLLKSLALERLELPAFNVLTRHGSPRSSAESSPVSSPVNAVYNPIRARTCTFNAHTLTACARLSVRI